MVGYQAQQGRAPYMHVCAYVPWCRAECLLQKGDSRQACVDCNKALEADPKFVKALFRRAKARMNMHGTGGAQACGALVDARSDLIAALDIDEDCQAARDMLKDVKTRSVRAPTCSPPSLPYVQKQTCACNMSQDHT